MSHTPSIVLRLALALALFSPVQRLDEHVQEIVQDARRPALEKPMRWASGSRGSSVVLAGLLVVAIGSGPAGPATARATVAALVPVNAAVEALKLSVNRERPDGERRRVNSSFPSSHAANAAVLALLLGCRWPRVAPLFWLLAGTVAFSRMYLNRHFLSDVLCGLGIGVGLGWLTLRWLRQRGWGWERR